MKSKLSISSRSFTPVFLALVAQIFTIAAGPGQQIIDGAGVSSGLCAHVGSGDGSITWELNNARRILVQGLEVDETMIKSARSTVQSKGLSGMVSFRDVQSYSVLPYASNLVNLLVADMDALGSKAPPQSEINRVVAPNGVMYLKRSGTWVKTVKPRPSTMDEWRQNHYGPDQNPISHDQDVKPPTSIQWLAWYENFDGNNEGLHSNNFYEIRSADGVVYNPFQHRPSTGRQNYMDARDAFSGVALWRKTWFQRGATTYMAMDNKFFALDNDFYLSAFDPRTGSKISLFPNAGKASNFNIFASVALRSGNTIVNIVHEDTVYAIDAISGSLKWKWNSGWTTARKKVAFPAVSELENILYLAVGDSGKSRPVSGQFQRYPMLEVAEIVALDLSSGAVKWRTSGFRGKGGGANPLPWVNKLLAMNGYVVFFGAYFDPCVGAFRSTDGQFLWTHNYQLDSARYYAGNMSTQLKEFSGLRGGSYFPPFANTGNPFEGMDVASRKGNIVITTKWSYLELNPANGRKVGQFWPHVPNQRCHRANFTDNYLIMGFAMYVNNSNKFTYSQIGRSTCASAAFPANGMVYYGPNGECGCFVRIRNAVALSSDPVAPAIPDNQRLVSGANAFPSTGTTSPQILPKGTLRSPSNTGKPLLDDWISNDYTPELVTTAVPCASGDLVAIANEQRLECRSGSSVVWSFTANARISRPPLVYQGGVFVASHDGTVCCLRETDGKLVWKFFGARNHRQMVAFSQVESSWPIFGAIEQNGKICFSAGRHPEADGGILVWGLEPASGAIAWKGTVGYTHQWVDTASRVFNGFVNMTVNGVLGKSGSYVTLPGISIDPNKPPAVKAKSILGPPTKFTQAPKLSLVNGGLAVDFSALSSNGAGADIAIFNLEGRQILDFSQIAKGKAFIPLTMLSSGRYIARIKTDGKVFGAEMLLK